MMYDAKHITGVTIVKDPTVVSVEYKNGEFRVPPKVYDELEKRYGANARRWVEK
jgi:hypothetical protein